MNHIKSRFCQQFKRIYLVILILSAGIFTSLSFISFKSEPDLRNKVHIVVIDAGHGGKDPGACGSFTKEKDVVLGVALKLGKYIEAGFPDVKVIYTRNKDEFIPLADRADIANKAGADLFISIHANSSEKKTVFGSETFVMGEHKNQSNFEVAKTENSVITLEDNYNTKYEGFDPNSTESYIIFSLMQRTYLGQSLKFAGLVQDEFREKANRIDRGVMQAGFLVLWRTTMPSVLIETGFISHKDEEKYLASQTGQDLLASAIFRAFRNYKTNIENSSKFENKHEIKTTDSNISTESAETQPSVYYKIQIFSSKNQIGFDDPSFNDFKNIEFFKVGELYKYAVGEYLKYSDAEQNLKLVRQKYPDAFIIGIRNKQIIPVGEARQILN